MKNVKKLLFLLIALLSVGVVISVVTPNDDSIMGKSQESKVQFYDSDDVDVFGEKKTEKEEGMTIDFSVEYTEPSFYDMYVYYIDVGQADCTLIRTEDENILIDGGNNQDGEDIVAYLTYLGVDKIDTIVATHMHEDHIGGLDVIMEEIPTDKVYIPNTRTEDLPDTKAYEDFMAAIDENGIITITAKQGDYIYQNGTTSLRILSPDNPPAGDLNDYSIVVKAENGENSFLFMGDASVEINKMIEEAYPKTYLDVDVLKAGHHGSSTSTDKAWIRVARPEYCIISCGEDNDYGHPHREVTWALKSADIQTYRMDTDGTVCVLSDGEVLTFSSGLTGTISLGEEGWVLP